MLEELEARGLLENTIVVVTADNGMPFPRIKGQEYELSNHLPLAIMWPEGISDPGRTIDEFVSFIDFAPTFLNLAGLTEEQAGMQPITGQSLSPFFAEETSRPLRDHVLIGKERHDVGRPEDQGYPIRGIVTKSYLYLHNYETDRYPAGDPETGYLNTDGGATKTQVLNSRKGSNQPDYWTWNMGKRPTEELYFLTKDQACMNNLANAPEHQAIKAGLIAAMETQLRAEGDPRIMGNGHVFDEYEYAGDAHRNFYERYLSGEDIKAGWINESDFEER
jgi:arylsulfatase A-like enzyme